MGSSTCDGDVYIHNLSTFIKTHERQLANALIAYKKSSSRSAASNDSNAAKAQMVNNKPVRLSLSLHHLYFLLGKFQEIGISVGPMNIRLDNLDDTDTSINYVSFLSDFHRGKSIASDAQSVHSMSSVKSVMSSVSALWSTLSSTNNNNMDNIRSDLKYLYSAFTKLPCLRLAPDARAKLIEGHEEYPFETSTPIKVFKNLFVLEISELDPKEIFGWHIISEKVRFLVIKKSNIYDPIEILVDLVQEDFLRQQSTHEDEGADKVVPLPPTLSSPPSTRGTFTSPAQPNPPLFEPKYHHLSNSYGSSQTYMGNYYLSGSLPDSSSSTTLSTRYTSHSSQYQPHLATSPSNIMQEPDIHTKLKASTASTNNNRLRQLHNSYYYGYQPSPTSTSSNRRSKRSDSMSSNFLNANIEPHSNMYSANHIPSSYSTKSVASLALPSPEASLSINENSWRGLKHLSFAENRIANISIDSFNSLKSLSSLDLSYNRISVIPEALSSLENLKSLNLSHNALTSTKGFTKSLSKLTILNLKGNSLSSLDSLDNLSALEKIDLRQNALKKMTDLKPLFLLCENKVLLTTIYIAGNPVTSNRGYRIDLFNLFNGVDFNNMIKIDGSRPGLFESRLLLDNKNAQLKLNKFLDESIISRMTESISTMNLSNILSASTTATTSTMRPSKLSASVIPQEIEEQDEKSPTIAVTSSQIPAHKVIDTTKSTSGPSTISTAKQLPPSKPSTLVSLINKESSNGVCSTAPSMTSTTDTVLQTNNNIINTPAINDALAPPNKPFSQSTKQVPGSSVLSNFLDQVTPRSPTTQNPATEAVKTPQPQGNNNDSLGYFTTPGTDSYVNKTPVVLSDENTSPPVFPHRSSYNASNTSAHSTLSPSAASQRRLSQENNPINRISIASPALPVITAATTTITTMTPTAPSTPISTKRSVEGFDSNAPQKLSSQLLTTKMSQSSLLKPSMTAVGESLPMHSIANSTADGLGIFESSF